MKVFVTGATGFVGQRLLRRLLLRGDQVVALTRNKRSMAQSQPSDRLLIVEGDPAKPGPWQEQVAGCDAVVTLAGEPVFGERWSSAFKDRLVESRIEGAKQMCEALAPLGPQERPSTWIAASAIGYYGSRGDEPVGTAAHDHRVELVGHRPTLCGHRAPPAHPVLTVL
jgi:NAD dependent epimerase/dehydratase family enzyme